MKKIFIISLMLTLFFGCTGKSVSVVKLEGIEPGMKCDKLGQYLENDKIPFSKDGTSYHIKLSEDVWKEAIIKCDGDVSQIALKSVSGTGPKFAKYYIDAQTFLLDTFRDNMITYEEGNKVINLNNGIRLRQYVASDKGIITHFEITIDDIKGSKAAWKEAVVALLKIGAEKDD